MTVLNPPPPRQLAMPSGGSDTRYYDLTLDLQPLGDTITSIVSVTRARVDGNTLGDGDLAISGSPAPWFSGYVVNWWQSGNLPTATDYIITVTVSTAAGRTIPYSCYQLLSPVVG
jgi:hypothetical protein